MSKESSIHSVFVGNLPYHTTEESLREHFSPAGTILSQNIIKYHGRSKGCAIVAFADKESASHAIGMHDSILDGRPLFVREDRHANPNPNPNPDPNPTKKHVVNCAKENCDNNGFKSFDTSGNDDKLHNTIFLSGLPDDMNWIGLKKYFLDFICPIDFAYVRKDRLTGKLNGYAKVVLSLGVDANQVLSKLNSSKINKRPLKARIWYLQGLKRD